MKQVLVVRPDWSDLACKWGAEQLKRKTISYANLQNWQVVDLYAGDAVKSKILQECRNVNYASLLGHGNEDVYTANRQAIVFQVGDQDTQALCAVGNQLAMNFLSCLIAKRLLPWMISLGLRGAMGYDEEFVFVTDQFNFPNSVAEPFFACHCSADYKIFRESTLKEAWDFRQSCWQEEIDKATEDIKRYLIHDFNCDTLLGDGDFNPSSPDGEPPTPPNGGSKKVYIVGDFQRESSLWDWILSGRVTLSGEAEIREGNT